MSTMPHRLRPSPPAAGPVLRQDGRRPFTDVGSAHWVTWIGIAVFVITTAVAHLVRTELDPLTEPISLYAHGEAGWLITVALLSIGAAGLAVAAAARSLSVVGRGFLAIWALMSMAAAVFPIDAPGEPGTLAGAIHEWAGFNFIFAILAAILFARTFKRGYFGPAGRRARLTAWMLTASGVSLIALMGVLHHLELGGLAQRVDWVVFLTWLTTVQIAVVAGSTSNTVRCGHVRDRHHTVTPDHRRH
jgi:hypothetical protein